MYASFFKRLLDLSVAFFALLVLLPILVLLVLLLYISNKGGVFFFQNRPGRNGEIFRVIKFKTMNDEKDEHGNLLPGKDRITSIGRIVRSYSLDEIPQLFNVLKGDMSLVGPRPLLVQYLPLYNKDQTRRHEVKPGITGLAQVKGRNTLSWARKFRYDVFYVDHISFCLDLKILWLTFLKVIVREGINADANSTMPTFTGKN
ncbi:MAG: sugar transferase [Lewinella sp.]|uniref:sugar transferase n=1 Tax=Lewinella sp. TaxID=2004506 RepID=UPI003D6B9D53